MTKIDLWNEYSQKVNEKRINAHPSAAPQIEAYTLTEFIFEKLVEITNKIENIN